jgi:hypothetical protein
MPPRRALRARGNDVRLARISRWHSMLDVFPICLQSLMCSMAWVTYGSPKAASAAVQTLDGKDFGGRPVKAELTIRGTEEQDKRAEEREGAYDR